uniref:Uncharacterized protein n=1 Tax=Glossina austeni TaxID=7395 RepID=A0A1A9UD54_GLOAU
MEKESQSSMLLNFSPLLQTTGCIMKLEEIVFKILKNITITLEFKKNGWKEDRPFGEHVLERLRFVIATRAISDAFGIRGRKMYLSDTDLLFLMLLLLLQNPIWQVLRSSEVLGDG